MNEKLGSILDLTEKIEGANDIIGENLSDEGVSTLKDRLAEIKNQHEEIKRVLKEINQKNGAVDLKLTQPEVSFNNILRWLSQNGKSTVTSTSDLKIQEISQLLKLF